MQLPEPVVVHVPPELLPDDPPELLPDDPPELLPDDPPEQIPLLVQPVLSGLLLQQTSVEPPGPGGQHQPALQ